MKVIFTEEQPFKARFGQPEGKGTEFKDVIKGQDGISPTVDIHKVDNETTITITDVNGSHVATIFDGEKGNKGDAGKTPIKGVDYFDGKDGKTPIKGVDYFDGTDGYTPVKGVDYFDGNDGYTPIKGKDYFDGEPFTYDMFTPEQLANLKGQKGDKGDAGKTPIKGTDYYTEAEKIELVNEISERVGGLEYVFLNSSQVDSTGKPNFTGKENKFYFVPDSEGASPNLFIEWLFTSRGWEIIGNSKINLDGYATETWVEGQGYLKSFTETDPTVPSWAKEPNKPTYTASEVGALPSNTKLFSGDYEDLENKPTIPTVPTSEINANTNARHTHSNKSVLDGIKSTDISNWNSKSTFSGDYDDLTNKPSIPTDSHINDLIDAKIGVIENGTY